jgi:hypothetical protein
MAQVVEPLNSKRKALSSDPNITKIKKKKKKKSIILELTNVTD